MKKLLLFCASLLVIGHTALADDVIERTGRDSIKIKPGTVAIPGAVSVGSLTVSGTSYGGSIQATAFVSPTISGTMAGNFVRTGTTSGVVVNSGTQTFSGKMVVTSGTAGPVTGQIGVSGTNLLFYNGTAWVQLNN